MSPRTHTWVINLDRSADRLARIGPALDALGLAWTRQRAVDARNLSPAQAAQLDETAYARKHGKRPALGELGCYLSHMEVMQNFLASPHEFALVLEDDAQLGAELPAVVAALERLSGRWDMVKLSGVHSGTPQAVAALTHHTQLAVMLTRCTGSSAYVVNRHAAQVYLDRLLPMELPYDHVFDRGWALDLKIRLASPPPCGHDQGVETTIALPQNRKFHWTQRLGAYGYRLRNEWQRVGYGLRHWWAERRAPAP